MGNTVRRFFVVVAAADRASFRCGLWPDARVNDKKIPRSGFPIGPLPGDLSAIRQNPFGLLLFDLCDLGHRRRLVILRIGKGDPVAGFQERKIFI